MRRKKGKGKGEGEEGKGGGEGRGGKRKGKEIQDSIIISLIIKLKYNKRKVIWLSANCSYVLRWPQKLSDYPKLLSGLIIINQFQDINFYILIV